jgi:hypothetical protein
MAEPTGYYDPYTEEYIENAPQDALDFYQDFDYGNAVDDDTLTGMDTTTTTTGTTTTLLATAKMTGRYPTCRILAKWARAY